MIYQNKTTMTTIANGSLYTTKKIEVKGKFYSVLVVTGKFNYILVSQDMHYSRRGSLGREFKSFDEAVKAYKSPEMKTELLKVEMGLI